MTARCNDHGIALRNLARRIERFLNALAKADLNPDCWEAQHIREALTCLVLGEFSRGERAMMKAERQPQVRPQLTAVNETAAVEIPTTVQLLGRLEAVMQDIG